MFSPFKIMERAGTGGRLVPFFKSVLVYFLVAGGEGEAGWVWGWAAAIKCAPVLSLALFAAVRRGQYARRVLRGLLCSALGDALLVLPGAGALAAGMAAFAAAHVCYVTAFGWRPRRWALGAALYAAAACGTVAVAPAASSPLALAVPPYALLLATSCWRAMARATRDPASVAAAVGTLAFLVSDTILGYHLFREPVHNERLLVMSTYYLAQLGITLSVLGDDPHTVAVTPVTPAAPTSLRPTILNRN